MLVNILTGAPLWVWPLLVFLVYIGFRSTRSRQTSIYLIYSLPLLGMMTLNSIRDLPDREMAWGSFLLFYVSGAVIGYLYQKGCILKKQGSVLFLKGEWVTFIAIMVIFWMNFAKGVTEAISPEFLHSPIFITGYTLAIGLAAGSFLGRAIRSARFPALSAP